MARDMDGLATTETAVLTLPRRLPAQRDPAAVYVASLTSPSSRGAMVGALARVSKLVGVDDPRRLDWSGLRFQHVAAIRSALVSQGYSEATVNQALAALRGTLKAAFNLSLMGADDLQKALAASGTVRSERLPAGRGLSSGEIRALFKACSEDGSPAGPRDAAVLALLYAGGLRRSEAVGLDLKDVDLETGAVTVRRGKGRKDRICYLADGALDAVADWVEVRGDDDGPLLLAVDKGANILLGRLSPQSTREMLRRRATQAEVDGFSPHDLRRSFISDMLDAGADLSVVQQLAGHASVTTTARYDRRGEVAKQKASKMLHVPYRRRAS